MSKSENIAEIILEKLIEQNDDNEYATHKDLEDIWNIMLDETDIVSPSDIISKSDKKTYSTLEKKIEKIIDDRAKSSVDS